jgi:hypothetical protein
MERTNTFIAEGNNVQRPKEKAEERGIEVIEVSECKTLRICLGCNSEDVKHIGRLLKCLSCELEADRDAIGVLNIGYFHRGGVNRVTAYPLLLRGNEMNWEGKSSMSVLEARIS